MLKIFSRLRARLATSSRTTSVASATSPRSALYNTLTHLPIKLLLPLALIASFFGAISLTAPTFAEEKTMVGCPEGWIESNVLGDTSYANGDDTITFKDKEGAGAKTIHCYPVSTGEDDQESGSGILRILAIVLNVLTFGVAILATVGIAISGFQYLTARDNDAVVAKAKIRIFEIVIGLIVYTILWSLLQFIIPGGIWGDQI